MTKDDSIQHFLMSYPSFKFTITISKMNTLKKSQTFEVIIKLNSSNLVWSATHSEKIKAIHLAIKAAKIDLDRIN
jgi:ribosome-associated translation inhibitor RaiA